MITFTEIKTAEDLEAVFAAAAAKHVEFGTIAEARDFIEDESLPYAAFFVISRKPSGMADRVGVRLP